MTETIRTVNNFLKNATKKEIEDILSEIVLSDRQKSVFDMCCIRKLGVGFAADSLGVCPMAVNMELRAIKTKIHSVLKT